ncbi:MAG: YgiT-type zinc finger protein [Phycisphaerae bacterium]|nr:YgiT-type zinc finger protein [Phycisphaerae bacterium]
MKYDTCEYCDGTVRSRRVTVDLRRGERLYVFHNVPLGVCSKCGERYYPGRVLEQLDEIAEHGLVGAKTVRVPTFDYKEATA